MPSTPVDPGPPLQAKFAALLETHRGILFKVSNTYCRAREDRRDLTQEIAEQLWRSFPRYDERRPFSTWMYRVALNVAISFVRKTGLRERYAAPLVGTEHFIDETGVPEPDERVVILERVIEGLDRLNRALLLLYLEEHSYHDIAEILGITETNVATRIGRLKQRIREDFAKTNMPADGER